MAEEAMAFIGSKYFNFNEEGDYIPHGSSSTNNGEIDAELENALLQRYGNDSGWLNPRDSDHTVEQPSPPWEETLANRVADYLAFYAPRPPPYRFGSFEDRPLSDATTIAEDIAYIESLPVISIETIEQFEELVASHQRNQASVSDPARILGPGETSSSTQPPGSAVSVQAPAIAPALPTSIPTPGASGLLINSTTGLGLVVNGKTFPKIEAGKERWYSQRPGQERSYSRYSDLVSHDKAKGYTPMPKATKGELQAARRDKTFG